uniref:Uncharacterized protein n=1 Tax=Schistocephalus solidus TaxID=70667 RepID=A0A0X3P7D3_SCHSO
MIHCNQWSHLRILFPRVSEDDCELITDSSLSLYVANTPCYANCGALVSARGRIVHLHPRGQPTVTYSLIPRAYFSASGSLHQLVKLTANTPHCLLGTLKGEV